MEAITDLFEGCADKFHENTFMWQKTSEKYEPLTYGETRKKVHAFAAGLLNLGIRKGDRIALLSEGRNDWVISELGILYAGAVNVPLSVKLNEQEIKHRIEHSGARMIVVSPGQAHKLALSRLDIPSVEKIIMLDDLRNKRQLDIGGFGEIEFNMVLDQGKRFLIQHEQLFHERWKSVKPDDYANISYTSGTTAEPKGIILTHRNYTANVEQSLTLMNIPAEYVSLLILPLDHAFAHTVGIYVLMHCGASLATVQTGKTPMDTLKNIPQNIKEVRPHFLMSVPSLAKNFKKNIESTIRAKGSFARSLFKLALATSYAYNGIGWNKGKGLRMLLKPFVKMFDRILYSKIREGFGGRLKFFVGGGALLDIELQRFFYAIGIPMYQGYGLSESAPVISSNSEARHKLGSSGYLVKNLELKICDEKGKLLNVGEKGEIVVRGENVMDGYWSNETATKEAIRDGWLYTGDLGNMDEDGFLYVYGRFKSLLIADDGEKYSPEGMEEAFVSGSPYIDQCLLYNNQNPYTIALIVPNREALRQWYGKHHAHNKENGMEAVLKLLEGELGAYKPGKKHGNMFPQRWLPAAIGILSEGFTEENELMNSTLKIVRNKITAVYADRIKYLYTPEGKNIINRLNMENIEKLMKTGKR